MQPDAARCPECGGEMEQGFIPDVAEGKVLRQVWVIGPPQKNWIGGIKIKRDKWRHVETHRCKNCGLLKSYAR